MPDSAPIAIELPTPFGVATVNVYLIPDDPLTLVDTGVATVAGLDALEAGFARAGHRIEDLRRIVLTHHHLDHFGLAAALVRRSGAEVWAFAGIADWLADYDRRMAEESRFVAEKYARHGLPSSIALGLRATDEVTRGYGEAVRVDRALVDGDTVPFAHREWEVHHRPGHSTSDLVFHDRARRELIGGDHLIGHISSNALVHEPLRTGGGPADPADRVSPLREYVTSLERTRVMDVDVVLPGHGAPVTGHRRLIDARAASTERRLRRIVAEVAAGRTTGFEIARSVWGDTALLQVQLVMSEVLGHLDVLEHDGRLVVDDAEGLLRFRVPGPVDASREPADAGVLRVAPSAPTDFDELGFLRPAGYRRMLDAALAEVLGPDAGAPLPFTVARLELDLAAPLTPQDGEVRLVTTVQRQWSRGVVLRHRYLDGDDRTRAEARTTLRATDGPGGASRDLDAAERRLLAGLEAR